MVLAIHSCSCTHTYDVRTHEGVYEHTYIFRLYRVRVRRVCVSSPSLALSLYAELRCIGVGKTGGGAIFVVVWEVREITSGERGSRSTSGETRRGEKRDEGIGREEGAKGSLRGHPCQPGDGHFAKNFRFVCTRRSEPGGTTNTDAYAWHAALPSLAPPPSHSLSLSLPVHPRFMPRGVSIRPRPRTFRYSGILRWIPGVSPLARTRENPTS